MYITYTQTYACVYMHMQEWHTDDGDRMRFDFR